MSFIKAIKVEKAWNSKLLRDVAAQKKSLNTEGERFPSGDLDRPSKPCSAPG